MYDIYMYDICLNIYIYGIFDVYDLYISIRHIYNIAIYFSMIYIYIVYMIYIYDI